MIEIAVILILFFVGVFLAVYRASESFAMDNLCDFLKTTWPGQLICALLFWAMAAFFYWKIATHGYVPVSSLGLIIYGTLGKWGWVYLSGFFGALFTFVGIWNLVVRVLYGKSDDE
jgi:hypothetical protein